MSAGQLAILPDRVAARIERSDGCWLWTGTPDHYGYGKVKLQGRWRKTHRLVYELLVGPIPDGLTLDHLCRNRACVNPDHLEPVTHQVNILRGSGLSAQNARKTHCKRGHPFDEANTYRYPNGGRYCRACNRRDVVVYKARARGPRG